MYFCAGSEQMLQKRRSQLRRSQRNYRRKKETDRLFHQQRAVHLEDKIRALDGLLSSFHHHALQSTLNVSNPQLYSHLCSVREYLACEVQSVATSSPPGFTTATSSGRADPSLVSGNNGIQRGNAQHAYLSSSNGEPEPYETELTGARSSMENGAGGVPYSALSPEATRALILGTLCTPTIRDLNLPSTYAHNETTFARKLQRYCLEHAYRSCLDARTDPAVLYRIFRLVPCAMDKDKSLPVFRRLVCAGKGGKLEIDEQPFYHIGGAGSQYPHLDEAGNMRSLINTRLPKRLLGFPPHATITVDRYHSQLRLLGFGGEWFDCQDVAGYLCESGFAVTAQGANYCSSRGKLHGVNFLGYYTNRLFPLEQTTQAAARSQHNTSWIWTNFYRVRLI